MLDGSTQTYMILFGAGFEFSFEAARFGTDGISVFALSSLSSCNEDLLNIKKKELFLNTKFTTTTSNLQCSRLIFKLSKSF